MVHRHEIDRQRLAEIEARRVPWSEVSRWIAPWLLAALLVIACLGGLWCASAAADAGTYAVGLAGAVLAFAALVWQLRLALGNEPLRLTERLLVHNLDSLVVLIALLVVLALGGLVLAARGPSAATSGAGYGLCLFAVVFIFANLKHYFDRHES